ncbi:hypothetical protein BC831DRAFT_155338 [Entophlyctis helioformis]|nr:hypothetical protein BC831DRAFT_155338 [Entophlyctis helioformis]
MLSSRPLSVLEPPQRAVRLPRKQTQQQQQQANPHKKLNKRPASHAAASANSAAASSLAAVGSNVWIPLNTAEDAVGKSTSTEALDSPAASSEPLGTIQAPSAPAPLAVNDAAVRRAAKHWRHLVQIRRSDSFTNSRLLRRCFLTWHQETAQHQMQAWIGDGDWRSSIRADVHYKFTVCGKAWSAWKAYVDAQKHIKANAVRAQVHAERRSMSTALRAFKAYADHRRTKAAAHHQAASWHRQNCLQHTFPCLDDSVQGRRVAKLQNELALRVRIRSLESRLFAEWERRFRRRQAIRQADGHAQIHCQMRIKRQALGRWKQAHFVRETRVVRQATASTFELRQIARRALCKWRLRWMQAKIKRDKLGTATWCYHRHLARTWFKRWQSETNQRQRAYAKADALSLLYERHAKQRAVRGLMQLVSAKRAAVSWHSKHTMQVAMRRWMHRLADQQAVRERALLEPGVLHHTTRLTRSCLDAWRLFVSLNKRERDAEDRAANHYRRTCCKRLSEVS